MTRNYRENFEDNLLKISKKIFKILNIIKIRHEKFFWVKSIKIWNWFNETIKNFRKNLKWSRYVRIIKIVKQFSRNIDENLKIIKKKIFCMLKFLRKFYLNFGEILKQCKNFFLLEYSCRNCKIIRLKL